MQQTVDFTNPSSIALHKIDNEVTTNYLSTIHIITHFLPHLIARNPEPAGIILVSSSLALAPMPLVANYCATKAAAHSLAWSLRAQLAGSQKQDTKTGHISVVEVLPPAVRTELHTRQGRQQMGMDLDDYADETWAQLTANKDIWECIPRMYQKQGLDKIEDGKRRWFEKMYA